MDRNAIWMARTRRRADGSWGRCCGRHRSDCTRQRETPSVRSLLIGEAECSKPLGLSRRRCNALPNSGFSFALRRWSLPGGDSPPQGRGNVLLDSMHATWDTPPKERTAANDLLYLGHQREKSRLDKFLFRARLSHLRHAFASDLPGPITSSREATCLTVVDA